jgi:hypothetical protein
MFDTRKPTCVTEKASDDLAGWADDGGLEIDDLRGEMLLREAEISRLRGEQLALLRKADRLQVTTADGARTLSDWLVANLDVSPQSAGRMVRVARSAQPDIEAGLTAGEFGVDRAAFLCQLRELGGPEDVISNSSDYSLGHLFGLIDRLRQVDALQEQARFEDRYMVLQSSLDEASGRFWGQTHGADWHTLEKALLQRESLLPALEGQSQGQRRVDALATICMDSLTGTGEPDQPGRAVTVAEVFVDASLAAPSFGEAGVTLASGPRVGPNTLSEILCTGKVRVIVCGDDHRPIGVSDLGEAIPPAVRSFVLHRDQGRCQIDGCRSRYRLQPHHIRERAGGGDHDPDNLITLCWYHHHVVVNERGFRIDRHPQHGRVRFQRPEPKPPEPT